MKKGYTHIGFVLDRSGSMSEVWDDVIGGYQEFIKTHKEAPGEATFSLAVFDHEYDRVLDFVNIKDTKELLPKGIEPRGMTALIESCHRFIDQEGEKLAGMREEDRPENVVIVIMTDGKNNASGHNYTFKRLSDQIKHQRENYKWQFLFLGAGLDAFEQHSSVGVAYANSVNYNPINTRSVMKMSAEKTVSFRSTCDSASLAYSDQEREDLK